MKRSFFLLVSILLGTLLSSCTSVYVPGTGNPGNPGGGGGGNPNGPIFDGGITRQTSVSYGVTTVSTQCQLLIQSPGGGPLAASGVTLIAPGNVHVPVAAVTTGTYMDPGTGWTYQPGQTYTLQVLIGSTLYTASIVAPGNITIPPFTSPGPIVWTKAGNRDSVRVTNLSTYSNTLVGPYPPAASGQVSTASSSYFPNSGDYTIDVTILEQDAGVWGNNAYPVALMNATDRFAVTSTK
ncbi:MAG TPA: hypothetical protein VHE12_00190 [bacterium]|nr:hypothetical protein [bacterium]